MAPSREKKTKREEREVVTGAGIFKQSMGARNQDKNRVIVPARQATLAGGIHSLESIPGLHKRLKIRAQCCESRSTWKVVNRAGIFKQPGGGARNRIGIGLSYRPTRLPRLAEFIPWNRFLGSINV
jgi:hypothetical protein